MKRYIWQVSLFLKIAISSGVGARSVLQPILPFLKILTSSLALGAINFYFNVVLYAFLKSPGVSMNKESPNFPLSPSSCHHLSYTPPFWSPYVSHLPSHFIITWYIHNPFFLIPPLSTNCILPHPAPTLFIFAFFTLFLAVPLLPEPPPRTFAQNESQCF